MVEVLESVDVAVAWEKNFQYCSAKRFISSEYSLVLVDADWVVVVVLVLESVEVAVVVLVEAD